MTNNLGGNNRKHPPFFSLERKIPPAPTPKNTVFNDHDFLQSLRIFLKKSRMVLNNLSKHTVKTMRPSTPTRKLRVADCRVSDQERPRNFLRSGADRKNRHYLERAQSLPPHSFSTQMLPTSAFVTSKNSPSRKMDPQISVVSSLFASPSSVS